MIGAPRTRLLRGYGPLVAAALLFVLMATFVPTVGKQVETRTVAGAAADAASGGGRRQGGSREPIATLGKHPANGGEIKVMAGRYGPYVTDGATNATLPKGAKPETLTLDEAVRLIDERAAKGPAKKGGRKRR